MSIKAKVFKEKPQNKPTMLFFRHFFPSSDELALLLIHLFKCACLNFSHFDS